MGIGLLFYSFFFLMASLDDNFDRGDYDYPKITINYALLTFSAVSLIVLASFVLTVQKNVTNLRRARMLAIAGKV
jgi:hypothetical protein